MDSLFLAQWFNDQDRHLVSEIETVLFSHGVRPVTGKVLGGNALDDGVKALIDRSDCLIALATHRERMANGGWTTHPWVINEYDYAKAKNKDAIAIVEDGIDWRGMYQHHQHIHLDRRNPSAALLQASNTVGMWKESAGETWPLQIFPEALAEVLEISADCRCEFRTVEQGQVGTWRPIQPVAEPGGVFLYVKGMNDRQKIEIRVATNRGQWKSRATPKWMQVTLRELSL